MPGPVVHTIIAEHLPDKLEDVADGDDDFVGLADEARRHRNALVFGAQGPDPFFFDPNDMPLSQPGIATGMTTWSRYRGRLAVQMYELTKPLTEMKRRFKGQMGQTIKDVSNSETSDGSQIITESKNLLVRIREVLSLAGTILGSFVKKVVLEHSDPFATYISPLQTCGQRMYSPSIEDLIDIEHCGEVESDPALYEWVKYHSHWTWFDNFHSRRTGDFITELLDIATGETEGADGEQADRPLLKSYALGYLSHFAADIVGHSYVNCITGGPYRLNQAQRHTTQEKVMDVWAYNRYYRNDEVPPPTGGSDRESSQETDGDSSDDTDDEFELELSLSDLDATFENRYYRSNEMVDSAMHRNFQFTTGELDPREWEPDQTSLITKSRSKPIRQALRLPDEIADNVSAAAERAYPDCFGPLTPGEVASSYRGWYKNFQSSTNEFGPAHPDEFPGTDLTEPLQEDLQDVVEEVEDVPEAVEDLIDSLFDPESEVDLGAAGNCAEAVASSIFEGEDVECLEEISDSITNFLTNLATGVAELFQEVAEVALEIVDAMETLWATINIRVWNFLLQKLYEVLFAAYKDLLMLVTAIGFGSMYSEDLHQSQLRNLWNPQAIDASGRTPNNYIIDPQSASKFPRKGMKAGHTPTAVVEDRLSGLTNQAHLLVPFGEGKPGYDIGDVVEQPQTRPGPAAYGTNTPEVFINDPREVAYDQGQTTPQAAIPNPERNGSTLRNEGTFEMSPNDRLLTRDRSLVFQLSAEDYYSDDSEAGDDGEDSGDSASQEVDPFQAPILGDAVSFTVALYERYTDPEAADLGDEESSIPNLNMSGDRAVGFPTWANTRGCDDQDRSRWRLWHGNEVPWLDDDPGIDSVFVPDLGEHY